MESPMADRLWSRRRLLGLVPALAALAFFPRRGGASILTGFGPHPEPRPGIDSSKVLKAADLENKKASSVYDMVRQIPQVVDGIRCHCGCAEVQGNYSLLSCYETGGMAQHCNICQGQGRLAFKLNSEGWSLNGIRAAIDAQFGDS
jgi:Protein of unknown function with PCYCGC motif